MELGAEDLRHAGLRSWTPEQALSEGVPPHHVPRTVRSHPNTSPAGGAHPPPPPPPGRVQDCVRCVEMLWFL